MVTALVIYDSILFQRGHTIRRWAEAIERRFVMYAKEEAPARSGELQYGISGEVTQVGPKHLQTIIRSTAPHSLYVLKGTTGPIMSDQGWMNGGLVYDEEAEVQRGYLHLRPGNGYPALFRVAVNGQQRNPFFARAATRTAARHSSLRGFSPGTQGFDL
jgi:hypothetical protein